jgi:hypothetical protein
MIDTKSISITCPCMRVALKKYYQVDKLTLYNVIVITIKEYGAFTKQESSNIHQLNADFAIIIPKVIHWLQVDFSLLREPRYDYKKEDKIDPHQVNTAKAAMVHFGLH